MDVVIDTPWVKTWRPELVGTLIFLVAHESVLLIHKKTGHGAGKINGPGGKLGDESIAACAARELEEETGLTPVDPVCRAELRFVERDGPQWLGFAFTATSWSGAIVDTREADPFWCSIESIPYDRMWPDDAIWLPLILAPDPAPIVGDFLFDDGELLDHVITESDGFPSVPG